MAKPQDFGMVINVGMGIVTLLYASIGITGYLYCQESCAGSITLNMPAKP